MYLPQKEDKGKFFWKKRWYSICSAHMVYDKDCPRCNVGGWHNLWGLAIGGFFHDHFYKLWFYYQNGNFPDHDYRKD